MEILPGRPDINTQTILSMLNQARKQQADLIVFPEMAVPGYFLGDTWEQEAFLKDCEYYGNLIVQASTDICVVFGNVAVDWNKRNDDGRVRKYDACFVAQNGNLMGNENFPYPFRIKTLHPNYREFDDSRHFCSLRKLSMEIGVNLRQLLQPVPITLHNKPFQLGCILCEDGWSENYSFNPIQAMHENGPADLLVNLSSSPYSIGKNNKRNRIFSQQARETHTPLVYINNTGIQNIGKTVYTFDGSSTVYEKNGLILKQCPPFSDQLYFVNLAFSAETFGSAAAASTDDSDIANIYHALEYGIDRFLKSINMTKVVIGISGGIDSAVAAALYAKILGPANVLLVNMPSVYNSQTTKSLSAELAKNLGCQYTVIPIQESVDHTITQLNTSSVINLTTQADSRLSVTSFVAENIQARDRSSRVLAGVAAAFGGGFTCNANKSELTIGYSTLYGDQSGFLAAIADLWKHQVYELAGYLNREIYQKAVIPQAIIDLVPSAELSAEQNVDQGRGDPLVYPYHDYLFKAFMEHWNRATPEDILTWYAEGILEEKIGCQSGLVQRIFPTNRSFIADLEKWWKLYTGMAIAKRIQAPPVLAVSRRTYGFDHREAQNGTYFTRKYLLLKEQLLAK
jgi:NAD+ synthase (glutamine-hydrolysing)